MCNCYRDGAGQLVVCDPCASAQIEALNAPVPNQVELLPGTLPPEECEAFTLSVDGFFAQLTGGR
jgi:hypothetical protein